MPVAMENTLDAYELALALGAPIIDVDMQHTLDDCLIALHDNDFVRTGDQPGDVSQILFGSLPVNRSSRFAGSDWGDSAPAPTIEQVLWQIGGRAVLTIEAKRGLPDVAALTTLIRRYGLERSVLINTDDAAIAQSITDAGMLPHVYGIDSVEGIQAADAAGAWLIELPWDASEALIEAARASRISRYIAGPIWTQDQVAGLSPGLHGHVSDAPGYTTRASGGAPETLGIGAAIRRGRVGYGWQAVGKTGAGTKHGTWIAPGGLRLIDGSRASVMSVMPGEMCGTMPGTYRLTLQFRIDRLPSNPAERIYARVCCPDESGTSEDADTLGYVVGLRANGELLLWSSYPTYGSAKLLASAMTPALVAGQVVTMTIGITPTTVTVARPGVATLPTVANHDWRGGYHWLGMVPFSWDSVVTVTDFYRS